MSKLLSTSEVKKVLGISLVTIRDLIKRKIIRAYRVGIRRWGIDEADLQTFIKSRANTEPGEVQQ